MRDRDRCLPGSREIRQEGRSPGHDGGLRGKAGRVAERIVIVGGGFSGLACADLIEHTLPTAEVVLLEATERLGGRVQGATLGPDRIPIDVGAAELYDIVGAPHLRRLVDRLGLPRRPLRATPTYFFDGHRIDDEGDLATALGDRAARHLAAFWHEVERRRPTTEYARAGHPADGRHPWSACTFADLLETIGDATAERFTAMQVHSDLAVAPSRTSGLYGVDNLLIDHPEYCRMFTIPGGNDQLVQRLAESLRCEPSRHARVSHIARARDGRLRVTSDVGTDHADAVVMALPPTAAASIAWEEGAVADAVSEHCAHHTHQTGYLRVTLLAATRFWADDLADDYFVSDAFDGVTVYDQSPEPRARTTPGILSWLIAGEPARRLAELSDDTVVAHVLDAAPPPLARLGSCVTATRVDRWFGARGVSHRPGGPRALSYVDRHQPVAGSPHLLFTGDSLYDATLSGALDAAAQTVALLAGQFSVGQFGARDVLRAAGLGDEAALSQSTEPPRRRGSDLPFLARPGVRA